MYVLSILDIENEWRTRLYRVSILTICHSFYFSSILVIMFWKSVGICIVQLQPVLMAMLDSSSLVSFSALSGLWLWDLKATFIRLFICLQENRERLPHCLPGVRHTISVIVSERKICKLEQFLYNRYNRKSWKSILDYFWQF